MSEQTNNIAQAEKAIPMLSIGLQDDPNINDDADVRDHVVEYFQLGDVRYVYDFDRLPPLAITRARSVFELHINRSAKPSYSLREVESSGDGDYMVHGFGYLLQRETLSGAVWVGERMSSKTANKVWDDAREFVNYQLSGKDWPRIQRCIDDFFSKVGLGDAASIAASMPLFRAFGPDQVFRLMEAKTDAAQQNGSTPETAQNSNE